MALEQEIKLQVKSKEKIDLSTLSYLSELSQEMTRRDHLLSTYFDTPDLVLSKQGLGLRMRQINEHYLQTVKTSGSVRNGLHQREEWEYDLAGPEWDLSTLRLTPLETIIDNAEIWSQLAPLFVTDFLRETMQLSLPDGTQIELAYDRGEVRSGQLRTDIHEIELELKSGDSEQLAIVAKVLSQQLNIVLSDISKAQMGYELLTKNHNNG
ncbi:MAG: CYTH domain-containing protein [Gammaproteobacteria bacterium]|nr:CYTH domain-containing protein [Gammaproteobacteria bacterium]